MTYFEYLHCINESLLFDAGFPEREKLPRFFRIKVMEIQDGAIPMALLLLDDGRQLGDRVTDDADPADGYRFHDAFHLACAAILGWSPVTRRNLGRKRRSNPVVDQIEDGGRAAAVEEGISQLVFSYAKKRNFLNGTTSVDTSLLNLIMDLTSHLEISNATHVEWNFTIISAYAAFRELLSARTGYLQGDMLRRSLIYLP